MQLKALLLALAVAGASATVALADNGHGKSGEHGKPGATTTTTATGTTTTTTTTETKGKGRKPTCTPNFSISLQGTVASAAAGDLVAVLVQKGNAHGRSLAGKQLTVDVSHAKVVRQGKKTSADLAAGDRVQIAGKACANADLSALDLVATKVVVLGAKATGDDGGTTTTTSTTGSTSTTTSTTRSTSTTTTTTTTT